MGFFPCRRVPPLLWTLYRRRLSHHFLLCKVITFLAFVIQSEIQRNTISVISFNALGEHAKGKDVFFARCETATLKSEQFSTRRLLFNAISVAAVDSSKPSFTLK